MREPTVQDLIASKAVLQVVCRRCRHGALLFPRELVEVAGENCSIIVEDDELANIAIESSKTIDIESFVPKEAIDDRYRDAPYYVAPEDKVGQEAFAVIRDAMKKKKMVGIARIVMAGASAS